jgi:hypothetical protein
MRGKCARHLRSTIGRSRNSRAAPLHHAASVSFLIYITTRGESRTGMVDERTQQAKICMSFFPSRQTVTLRE